MQHFKRKAVWLKARTVTKSQTQVAHLGKHMRRRADGAGSWILGRSKCETAPKMVKQHDEEELCKPATGSQRALSLPLPAQERSGSQDRPWPQVKRLTVDQHQSEKKRMRSLAAARPWGRAKCSTFGGRCSPSAGLAHGGDETGAVACFVAFDMWIQSFVKTFSWRRRIVTFGHVEEIQFLSRVP